MGKVLIPLLIVFIFLVPPKANASDSQIFFTTVIYGTVAGALVGVATLAFASNPGDNLMNIARGASLGLYTGILLGAYLYYQVGSDNAPSGTINPDGLPPADDEPPQSFLYKIKQEPLYGFALYPTVQKGQVGVGVNLITLRF